MIGEIQFKLGEVVYKLTFDEKSDMEALHRMAVLGNPPRYCHECKNTTDFKLDSNKDKEGNIYVNVVCTSCWSKAKLGQYKSGGYFWHKFEQWKKKNGDDQTAGIPQADVDMPF